MNIKKFGLTAGEVVTQTSTLSTGTVLPAPASTGNVTGTLGATQCIWAETMTQAVTGVT